MEAATKIGVVVVLTEYRILSAQVHRSTIITPPTDAAALTTTVPLTAVVSLAVVDVKGSSQDIILRIPSTTPEPALLTLGIKTDVAEGAHRQSFMTLMTAIGAPSLPISWQHASPKNNCEISSTFMAAT